MRWDVITDADAQKAADHAGLWELLKALGLAIGSGFAGWYGRHILRRPRPVAAPAPRQPDPTPISALRTNPEELREAEADGAREAETKLKLDALIEDVQRLDAQREVMWSKHDAMQKEFTAQITALQLQVAGLPNHAEQLNTAQRIIDEVRDMGKEFRNALNDHVKDWHRGRSS